MLHANCPVRTRSLFAALLVAVALLALGIPRAYAEPSTNERRRVAEEVAASVCKSVPAIPLLPSSVNPRSLCQSVLVENIDPEGNNNGIMAACVAALPSVAKLAAESCATVLDKMLDPARQLFLDKVVPAAQQLACVISAPAAFDCLAQQVHVWLKESIVSLWQGLITVLTSDTEMVGLIDGWPNTGIVSLYSDVGGLGATVLLGLVLTSLIISAIRFDFRQFGSTLLGVVVWGLFWSGGAVVAVLLVKTSDDAAQWLAGRPDGNGQTDLARAGKEFGNWVDYITGATPTSAVHPLYNPGSFSAILIGLLLIGAIVATLVALLMRNIALLLIIVALPLTLAGAAGPRMTREWFTSALRLFLALLLAKPLIVVAVRLGAVLVSVPDKGEPQATFSDAMLGVAIILLAGLLPGVIYKFSGGLMNTSAGAAPRAGGGVSAQSAQSFQSSMDITRLIMERNAPRPLRASGSAGSVGSAGESTGGRAATAGSLGALAGPIALAATATALAGGALESGGRWMAGQAATGGGVLGDVEAPHVPGPPVSRMGYFGGGHAATAGQPAGSRPASESPPPAPEVTVVQSQPVEPARTPLPPSGRPLVIPGSIVPDHPAELPAAPKALSGRGDTHE